MIKTVKRTDGGSAFPTVVPALVDNRVAMTADGAGMSLRDYFAAQMMAGWTAVQGTVCDRDTASQMARDAYVMADAMLWARDEKE